MSFESLLSSKAKKHKLTDATNVAVQVQSTGKADKRGCKYCPLNEIHGVHKIFGKVKGKDIFIWVLYVY